jgi:hypothetical protein
MMAIPTSWGGVDADQVEESGAAAEVLHERGVGIALAGRAEPAQAEVIPLPGHGDVPHGGGGLRGQNTGPVKLAIAQMHLQEAGCVPDGPEQAAVGGTIQQEPAEGQPAAGPGADNPARQQQPQWAAPAVVSGRGAGQHVRGMGEPGHAHPQVPEDLAADQAGVWRAGRFRDGRPSVSVLRLE